MTLIRINRNPSRRQLYGFGLLWFAFFSAIGWMVSQKGHTQLSWICWIAATLLPVIGWVFPSFMRWMYIGMAYAAFPIGLVVSHAILAVVYYLLMTPLGLTMRLTGYDPMARKFDDATPTYWVPHEPPQGVARYFRQF